MFRTFRSRGLGLLLAFAVGTVIAPTVAGAVQADSTGGTVATAGASLISFAALAIGTLGTVAANLVKRLAMAIDGSTAAADQWLTRIIKPIQPIVASAVGLVYPLLKARFHLPALDPALILSSLAGTATGLVGREFFLWLATKLHLGDAAPA